MPQPPVVAPVTPSPTVNGTSSPLEVVPQSNNRSALMKKTLGILVSLVAIGIMVVSVEWAEVGSAIARMQYWVVIPSVLLIWAQMFCRALRWRCLLPVTERGASIRTLFDAIMIGNLATSILPLRAGEFVRPFLLSLQTSYRFSVAFVSVVIERFFDLSIVLISFGIVSLFIDDIPDLIFNGALVLSLLAISLMFFIIIGALLPERLKRVSVFFCNFLPEKFAGSLHGFVVHLLDGATALRSPLNLAKVVIYSWIVWLITFFSYFVYFWLFDIPGDMIQAVVVTIFIALAVAAPSAPGFIGVYQIGCIAAFTLFGVDLEAATAYALISHLIQYLTTILYGGYALSQTEWKLKDLIGPNRTKATGLQKN